MYHECGWKYKIEAVDGNERAENIHAKFGTFIHEAIESRHGGRPNSWITFGKTLLKWCKQNPQLCDEQDPKVWVRQGFRIYDEIFDWLTENFSNFRIVESECKLLLDLSDKILFKGYIDLVLEDQDGNVHIVDFKTSTKGWSPYKKQDDFVQYQLLLYKQFLAQKMNIDVDKITCHFIILKRQPAKNDSAVDLFTISSSKSRLEVANKWLTKQAKGIEKKLYFKNKTSCKFCPWKNSKQCP